MKTSDKIITPLPLDIANLKSCRRGLGLTSLAMSQLYGCSHITWRSWENGSRRIPESVMAFIMETDWQEFWTESDK